MKKRITGLFAATLLALSMMAVPAMADDAPSVSDEAAAEACFGQARAAYTIRQDPGVWGQDAAERGSDNPDFNSTWIDNRCH